jgi:hypothetical protein
VLKDVLVETIVENILKEKQFWLDRLGEVGVGGGVQLNLNRRKQIS